MDRIAELVAGFAVYRWRLCVGLGAYLGPTLALARHVGESNEAIGWLLVLVVGMGLFFWWQFLRMLARKYPLWSVFTTTGMPPWQRTEGAGVTGELATSRYAVRVGGDENGVPVVIDPANKAGILVSGMPGSGKTVLVQLLLAVWRMAGARVVVADFKGGGDFSWLAEAEAEVIEDDAIRTLEMLREVDAVIAERMKQLRHTASMGPANFWDRTQRPPLYVVAVDEVQELLETNGVSKEDKERATEAASLLRSIVKRGRAAGVIVVLSTQKADATAIPTSIRDVMAIRVSGEQRTREASRAALGEVAEEDPQPHVDIEPGTPGRMVIAGQDSRHARLFQAFYRTPAQLRALVLHMAPTEGRSGSAKRGRCDPEAVA